MRVLADKRKRKVVIVATSIMVVLAIIVTACAVYLNDYYRADPGAIAAYLSADTISRETLDDNTLVYAPDNATMGLIFYPGGKVEYTAYAPLMEACASKGILCVLVEMPFHLAVFDVNAADGIQERYPAVENWYIGGHSLGGSMAASYVLENAADYEGLILLGAYSTADLSGSSLKVLSVYGSEDHVLNREKYENYKSNLPDGFTEVVIAGGCHAYFGMYGVQDGDGTPTVSNKEQIDITADAVAALVGANA